MKRKKRKIREIRIALSRILNGSSNGFFINITEFPYSLYIRNQYFCPNPIGEEDDENEYEYFVAGLSIATSNLGAGWSHAYR